MVWRLEGDRSGLATYDAARGTVQRALPPETGVDHLEAWWDPVGGRFLAISIRSGRRIDVRPLDPATGGAVLRAVGLPTDPPVPHPARSPEDLFTGQLGD